MKNNKMVLIWLIVLSAIVLLLCVYTMFFPNIVVNVHDGNYTMDIGDNLLKVMEENARLEHNNRVLSNAKVIESIDLI